MRKFAGVLVLWLLTNGTAFGLQRVEIVFDIDWVLVCHAPEQFTVNQVIAIGSTGNASADRSSEVERYVVNTGMPELLHWLTITGQNDFRQMGLDVVVSLHSHGDPARNFRLAHAFKLPDGGSLFEAIQSTGGTIKSIDTAYVEHLPGKTVSWGAGIDQRPKKNLDYDNGIATVNRLIIEDQAKNLLPQHLRNVIQVPHKYLFYGAGEESIRYSESLLEVMKSMSASGIWGLIRENQRRFLWLHGKAGYLKSLLTEVFARSAANGFKTSLAEISSKLQYDLNSDGQPRQDADGNLEIKGGGEIPANFQFKSLSRSARDIVWGTLMGLCAVTP